MSHRIFNVLDVLDGTCPEHYIYILHMYMNYKILINVKLLISQDPMIGFMRFWTFLKALVMIYLTEQTSSYYHNFADHFADHLFNHITCENTIISVFFAIIKHFT